MSSRVSASPAVALTIAGSDNSCGAGIQADLKTFTACGVYGLTAVTCIVSEVPGCVEKVQAVSPDVLRSQICILFDHYPIAAVKTGMLYSRALLRVVSEELADRLGMFHLVVDPVMVATSGATLLAPDAVAAVKTRLIPLAAVVTPNLDEATILLGRKSLGGIAEALELAQAYGVPFLLKGGHAEGDDLTDCLAWPTGETKTFTARRAPHVDTHGSGCTLSAAIAAQLAKGKSLSEAVTIAHAYLQGAIHGPIQVAGLNCIRHL